MSKAAAMLGQSGPFALKMPRYRPRPAQLEMAAAVERAIVRGETLICEAGTGTGKTLAYLIPALLSGKKVVISTATKALQDQIMLKDLPLIERVVGPLPHIEVVKGLSNYLCRRRYNDVLMSADALRPTNAEPLQQVGEWVEQTQVGELSELRGLAEDHPLRAAIASSSDTRIGADCAYFEDCFVTALKRAADDARILVVNHHLFFADLALRGPNHGAVLPDYDVVIFDEAHQMEEIATSFFGVRVSQHRLALLLLDGERALISQGAGVEKASGHVPVVAQVLGAAHAFWKALKPLAPLRVGRQSLPPDAWKGPLREVYANLRRELGAFKQRAEDAGGEVCELLARRIEQMAKDFDAIADHPERHVAWIDRAPRAMALAMAPVDMSHALRDKLFEPKPACILTSATLAAKGGFGFLRRRLGLTFEDAKVAEMQLASPFDYGQQCMLYLPTDLPLANDGQFAPKAAARMAKLLAITGGGALILCTSYRNMSAFHRLLSQAGIEDLQVQGQAPKAELLERFRRQGNGVLVATMSFWEGVDVPGNALRLVILDKIPFPVPTDPLFQARSKLLEEQGQSAFAHYSLPTASIALRQGFGRLIRSEVDRGVVALLDGRALQKPYGRLLLRGLPKTRRTSHIEDVQAFFEAKRLTASVP